MNRARTLTAAAAITACGAWALAASAQSSSGASGIPGATGSTGTNAPSGTMGTAGTTVGAPLSAADRRFLMMAASSGLMEVAASRLAVERARNPDTRAIAQRMVDDHTKANAELTTLATRSGMTDLPSSMAPKHRAQVDRLRNLSGPEFDRQYATLIGVTAHHEAVALFDQAARGANHPDLKAFAQSKLPALREHLAQSQRVATAVGVSEDTLRSALATAATDTSVTTAAPLAGTTGVTAASTGGTGSGGPARPSDTVRATTGNASTASGPARTDGTLGQASSGRSDADWERGRASSYSLLPMTSYGYVGGNIGRANWDSDCGNNVFNCDEKSTGWKIYTGGLISRMVGLEIGYIDFGRPDIGGGEAKAYGVNASVVANLPIDPVNLFARFGTTYGWTETSARPGSGLRSGEDDGFGLAFGLGIGFDLAPNFQVTAEWDRNRFKFVNGDQDLDLYSVGLRYRF